MLSAAFCGCDFLRERLCMLQKAGQNLFQVRDAWSSTAKAVCRIVLSANPIGVSRVSRRCDWQPQSLAFLCNTCNSNNQRFGAPPFMLSRRQHDSAAMTSKMLAWLFEGLLRTSQKSRGLAAGQYLSAAHVRQPLQGVLSMLDALIHIC